MSEALKPVEWMGDSLDKVRSFSKVVRQQVGFQLELVQHGLDPTDWKPMKSIAPGVKEIRVHVDGEHRILYVAKFQRAIYVLKVFAKTTQKTPRAIIELARGRYQEVLKMENQNK